MNALQEVRGWPASVASDRHRAFLERFLPRALHRAEAVETGAGIEVRTPRAAEGCVAAGRCT